MIDWCRYAIKIIVSIIVDIILNKTNDIVNKDKDNTHGK